MNYYQELWAYSYLFGARELCLANVPERPIEQLSYKFLPKPYNEPERGQFFRLFRDASTKIGCVKVAVIGLSAAKRIRLPQV